MVRQALKSVFRQRPPIPKYSYTFNIEPVLSSLALPNDSLTLKQLTKKTVILTIYSTLSRVSSLKCLGPVVTEHEEHVILHLVSLEKQGRPGNVRGYIPVPKFEDPLLCPARALLAYVNKVKIN